MAFKKTCIRLDPNVMDRLKFLISKEQITVYGNPSDNVSEIIRHLLKNFCETVEKNHLKKEHEDNLKKHEDQSLSKEFSDLINSD